MVKRKQIVSSEEQFDGEMLESFFHTSKKTIQEYVNEIERHCRYKSIETQLGEGTVLDDRSKLIDLYDACMEQDAHLKSVVETQFSQVLGERYMMAHLNEKGKYVKDIEETKKIQGSQFIKIIKGIAESRLYGYTLFEILPDINPLTGKLSEINQVERRNVLPNQKHVVKRQGIYNPGWDLTDPRYTTNYSLINTGGLGLFSATTPIILAKKFTLANYVNFSHTYGQPIIHGKTASEQSADRARLANQIASAAQNKVIVTGLEDEVDIKTFTMSNSEKIYTGLIEMVNKEVSNLIVGSESVAGETQAYVGSSNTHQDVFRDRIEAIREYVENEMNENIIPRLVKMGYLKPGNEFKYSNRLEMSNKDKISLYTFITDRYEVSPDEIEKEFGVSVGKQLNLIEANASISSGATSGTQAAGNNIGIRGPMTDEEYFKRYGRHKAELVNFLRER